MQFARIVIACLSVCASCTLPEESMRDVVEVPVDDPPAGLEAGQHDIYKGRDVYYYAHHWYYRRGKGWVYLSEEPDELRSRRQRQLGEGQIAPDRGSP